MKLNERLQGGSPFSRYALELWLRSNRGRQLLALEERELKRVKNGKLYLIPASEDTRGHGTTGMAKFWKAQVQELLATVPRRAM